MILKSQCGLTHLGDRVLFMLGAGLEPIVRGGTTLLIYWCALYWMYRQRLRDGERLGWWFDPRTGIEQRMDADLSMAQVQLQTPTHGPDWVIVIDATNQGFVPPGIVERCHT